MREKKFNKTKLAKKVGVSRSSLYYKSKRETIDQSIKKQLEEVLAKHPSYGHKRIALTLKLNKKRILRVMKKFGIKPYRRRVNKPRKINDEGKTPVIFRNEIKNIHPIKPNLIWASDFTYIKFKGVFIYLATIIDIYTREIVGFNVSTIHDTDLVLGALRHALEKASVLPVYLHSDQGSEYDAKDYKEYVLGKGIIISMSRKNSPWENSFQESFFSQFKVDLGFVDRFETMEELLEAIYQAIHYYNNERIHTKLKTNPVEFRQNFEDRLLQITV